MLRTNSGISRVSADAGRFCVLRSHPAITSLSNIIRVVTRALYLTVQLVSSVHRDTTIMERTRMASSDADMQRAVNEYHSGLYVSKQAAARANNVPPATLCYRLAGLTSHTQRRERQQIPSNAEEKTFVSWVTRLISTGFPASPAVVVEIAGETAEAVSSSPVLCHLWHNRSASTG